MPTRPVVLVTGAAKRLGRSIGLELAAQGWDVAVHCRRSIDAAEVTAEDLRRVGATAQVFPADLADETACRALVPAVLAHFQRLDAVVNNASTFHYDTVESFGHAAMESHWRANTAPAVLLATSLHAHLAGDESRRGCVVNLLDQKLWNPNPDYLSYTLSKAALEAATTALALALAPRVRVCGVAPGVTLPSGTMNEAEFDAAHRLTPLQRSSTPEDIAQAVRFLLDARAITGTTLLVDGGQHLWGQPRDVAWLVQRQGA
jgi:NAD(P)-dependent dehydrogenase (short-subunit alcohol dehydrogenase family)